MLAITGGPAGLNRRQFLTVGSLGFGGLSLASLLAARAVIFAPGASFGERLTRAAADLDATGLHVFDLQIAILALEAGANTLRTHDAAFVRLPGLRLADPFEE